MSITNLILDPWQVLRCPGTCHLGLHSPQTQSSPLGLVFLEGWTPQPLCPDQSLPACLHSLCWMRQRSLRDLYRDGKKSSPNPADFCPGAQLALMIKPGSTSPLPRAKCRRLHSLIRNPPIIQTIIIFCPLSEPPSAKCSVEQEPLLSSLAKHSKC